MNRQTSLATAGDVSKAQRCCLHPDRPPHDLRSGRQVVCDGLCPAWADSAVCKAKLSAVRLVPMEMRMLDGPSLALSDHVRWHSRRTLIRPGASSVNDSISIPPTADPASQHGQHQCRARLLLCGPSGCFRAAGRCSPYICYTMGVIISCSRCLVGCELGCMTSNDL